MSKHAQDCPANTDGNHPDTFTDVRERIALGLPAPGPCDCDTQCSCQDANCFHRRVEAARKRTEARAREPWFMPLINVARFDAINRAIQAYKVARINYDQAGTEADAKRFKEQMINALNAAATIGQGLE